MAKKEKEKTKKSFKMDLKSIRSKLIIIISLLLIVPLAISVIASYVTSTNKAMEDSEANLEWQSKYLATSFEEILSSNLSALKAFSVAPSTITYLQDPYGGVIPDSAMLTQMQALDEYIGDGNFTIMTASDGMQVLRTSGDCVDVSGEDDFEAAMNGEIYISNLKISKSTGDRIITIVMPVFSDTTGEVLGCVQRNYNCTDLHNFLAENASDAFILDREGNVIAHAQYDFVGEDAHEEENRSESRIITSGKDSEYYESDTGKGYTTMISYVTEPTSGFKVAVAAVSSQVLASARSAAMLVVIISIVMLVIAIIIAFFFANSIAAPIQQIATSIMNLSDGHLNTQFDDKVVKREDEVGQISHSSQTLLDKLQDVIGKTKNMSERLSSSSGELSMSADNASQAASQVTSAVDDISKGAVSQAESVQTAVLETNNMGDNISLISDNVTSLNEASDAMQEACNDTMEALNRLISQSEKVSESVSLIAETIESTNASSNEISTFTQEIDSIATQTNLLSLNASIEAARAGEAGKGFAVVATEISNLAKQSKESADRINEIVDKLMQDASESVTVMQTLTENFEEQGKQLDATKADMKRMSDEIQSVTDNAKEIEEKVSNLDHAKVALGEIIESLSAISEENAASTEQTNASMQELSATFSLINESADELKQLAQSLTSTISYFEM